MESLTGICPMRRWIAQATDHVAKLEDRSRPAVSQQEREGIRLGRTNVQEVDTQPVDFCAELPQGVEQSLTATPIVPVTPLLAQCLHLR